MACLVGRLKLVNFKGRTSAQFSLDKTTNSSDSNAMETDQIPFMGTMWLQIEDGMITLGINEDGLDEIEEIVAVDLPKEGDIVDADEICGELDSRDGPLNIYSPVTGSIVEVNEAVVDTPELVREDPYGEGWILRIEPDDEDDLQRLQADQNTDDE